MSKWIAVFCLVGSFFGSGLAAQATTLSEGFDDITTLTASGWVQQNNSSTLGSTNWFQGNSGVFAAQTGTLGTEYIGANFNNTSGTGHISNWLISPEIEFMNGKSISFYTRTPAGSLWPDRLELRLNLTNNGTNVGTLSTDVGDFTTVAVEVNPTLVTGGYPETWTYYSYTYTGATLNGRFAFRYNVTDGGPSGANSNYIGIDTVEYNFAPPSVTINQGVAQNDPTTNGNILFDVVFSESVTGFDGSDVSLAASTAPGTLTANVSGSGTNYTVTVFGMTGAGDVVASIVAGRCNRHSQRTSKLGIHQHRQHRQLHASSADRHDQPGHNPDRSNRHCSNCIYGGLQ